MDKLTILSSDSSHKISISRSGMFNMIILLRLLLHEYVIMSHTKLMKQTSNYDPMHQVIRTAEALRDANEGPVFSSHSAKTTKNKALDGNISIT